MGLMGTVAHGHPETCVVTVRAAGAKFGPFGFQSPAASSHRTAGASFKLRGTFSFLTSVENGVLHDLIAFWRQCGRVTREAFGSH